MMDNVLISVVIPTYSRSTTLKRAIDSVLNQTYHNFEIIVIDDNPSGSVFRSECFQAMDEYKNNEKVFYYQNPENLGGAGSRNIGVQKARGEYIAFLDDDDEYLSERLEKQLHLFLNSTDENLALVYCYAKYVDKNGQSTYSDCKNFSGNCLYEAMEQNCIAATSQWMVKKSAFVSVGGFPNVSNKQDSQALLKLLDAGYTIDVVKEELSLYYDYDIGNRISGINKKNLNGELLYIIECRKLYYKLDTWQIINVEYSFAQILYSYYKVLNIKDKEEEQWRVMKLLNKNKAYTYCLKELWHKLKGLKNGTN